MLVERAPVLDANRTTVSHFYFFHLQIVLSILRRRQLYVYSVLKKERNDYIKFN